ncbi:PGPI peptidase, partial [Amia calva]|nr:PGPI peptidase [Amia calva]
MFSQGLEEAGLGEDVELHIKELPVSYSKAQELVVSLWKTFRPQLAVHVGIAPGCRAIMVEQSGKNQAYKERDVRGVCPANYCCIEGGPERIDSVIDMKSLTRHLRKLGLDIIYSRDAGRYLCDFVYYTSLYHSSGRAALIHIPTSGSLTATGRLLPSLKTIIQTMLQQIEETMCFSSQHIQDRL